MMMNSKQPVSIHGSLNHGSLHGRYSPPYRNQDLRRMQNPSGNIFGGLDDNLLARAEALAAADISKNSSGPLVKPDSIYGHTPDMSQHNGHGHRGQMQLHGFSAPGESMLDQLAGVSMPGLTSINTDHSGMMVGSHPHTPQMYSQSYTHPSNTMSAPHHPGLPNNPILMHPQPGHPDMDCDPRELEAFAEHFKQRRIKLGVTQADVGNALGKLKLPGVGSLSQSTICRFESLTLSHNNMVALKPVLQAWLEEAEKAARESKQNGDLYNQLADKKRKRTSIAAPEKRSLEAYFAIQPRPSGEKIAQIAEKLDLKKNVVRVWFCNQRQKQKRMKFSATMSPHGPHGVL